MQGKKVSVIILSLLVISVFALTYKVQPAWANGTIYIKSGGSIDPVLMQPDTDVYPTTDSVDWWPMFHHDPNHTGFSTSIAPNTNHTAWTYALDSSTRSSPAVVDGKVYIGSGKNSIYALNATTGELVWKNTIGVYLHDMNSPAVFSDKVYISSSDGNVYCFDASTGALLWTYTTGDIVYSSPAVVDEKVYVGSYDGNVYALNAQNGGFVWSYKTDGLVGSSPAVADGRVYVGAGYDTKVYCLDASTGTLLWTYATGDMVYCSPAVADGKVYIGSWDSHIYALNASTGAFVWSYATGGRVSSGPAAAYDKVYVGSNDGNIYALNATTGDLVWSYATNAMINIASPAVADGKVYIGSQDQNIYALNSTTGALVWSYADSYNLEMVSPAVVDGYVYIGSYKKIYAFRDLTHDIAITRATPSKAVVGQDLSLNVNVTAANQGDFTEVLNVTVYANTTAISKFINITLEGGNSTTETFAWDTTGFAKGNYTISAIADAIPGETNTANNNFTGGWVTVSMVGDLTGGTPNPWDFVPDGKVDGKDITIVALCYGSAPGCPPPYVWNANCDVNNDGKIDGKDIAVVALHYGQADP